MIFFLGCTRFFLHMYKHLCKFCNDKLCIQRSQTTFGTTSKKMNNTDPIARTVLPIRNYHEAI